jgi:flagellar basal-body rod protein FlgC
MTTFSAMDIGRTGVGFANHWIDTIAHNVANATTDTAPGEEPFRALRPLAQTHDGGPFAPSGSGVRVGAFVRDEGEAPRVHDPSHPFADADGYVTKPLVDLGGQMVDMMIAQRGYQANLSTVKSAHEAYQAELQLGGR